jgi:endoglycosylceramidase
VSRRIVSLLAAAAVALAAAAAGDADGVAAAPAGTFGSTGRWITYPDGRVFVPHGFNTVVTRAPFANTWFGAADARFLAGLGFTAVRVAILPEALEPEPGRLDTAYVQRFVDQARLLARYGISTLVALNQDRYAQECGGDGFPAWAVLERCTPATPLESEGPWRPFWANAAAPDGVGLQEHLLGWWRLIAGRFAGIRGVLGYDLLNEPKAPDDGTLDELWRSAIDAVRAADRAHVTFVESRDPAHPASISKLPSGTGYTGHIYCPATLEPGLAGKTPPQAAIAGCIRANATTLARQVAFATRERRALLVGEFGASDELREQTALVDAMAAAFVPWTVYAYSARLDSSGAPPQSLLRDERKPGSLANAKTKKLDALVVPHPIAVGGTPRSWRYDRRTRRVAFSYSTARVGGGRFSGRPQTTVFVPARVYPTGYTATASGGRIVSKPTAPWLGVVANPGARIVRVTIRPRRRSTTQTPLEVGQCGFDLGRCG